MARRKELHLLDRMRDGPITTKQRDWYYRQFPRLPGHIAGEWTPRYRPCRPSLGHHRGPWPRRRSCSAIVREPVERYRSGLKQWQEQAKRRSLRRDDKAGKREALMRGFYGRQVQRLVDVVGRDRLLVLQYERCVRGPAAELARTLDFLGVSPWAPDERLLTMRYNQTVGQKRELSARDEAALAADTSLRWRCSSRWCPTSTSRSGRASRIWRRARPTDRGSASSIRARRPVSPPPG